jgi:nicotinate-nucleotide adenylyltransferase
MQSLAIFGGTFNPIHYGHLRMAEEILEKGNFHKILFIPAGNPPLKKSELADARDRFKMVEIAIKDNPSFIISDKEIRTKETSYAVRTLTELLEEYGTDSELYFILGSDAFYDFHKWRQPKVLLSLCHFIIISRPSCPFVSLTESQYLKMLSKGIMEKLDRGEIDTYSLPFPSGKKVSFYRLTQLGISASLIRKCLKEGKNVKYLLPDAVESYIMEHKLYV